MSAIFTHDSQWCTAGVGKKTNNCGNIRSTSLDVPWTVYRPVNNNGTFAKFPDIRTGILANVDLYVRKYMGRSPSEITRVWAQTKSGGYFNSINECYQ